MSRIKQNSSTCNVRRFRDYPFWEYTLSDVEARNTQILGDDIVRPSRKLEEVLMKLYEIRNSINDAVYVGITRTSLEARFRAHKHSAKRGIKTPLYCMIRKYGFENFYIVLISEFQHEEDLLSAEYETIKAYRESEKYCLNILDGGESYFPIKDWETHKQKLRKARAGRKPALGLKHSEENKKKFSEFGKLRWDLYGRYPKEVLEYGFTESNKKFGISKTHYYRLKKLAESNDLS